MYLFANGHIDYSPIIILKLIFKKTLVRDAGFLKDF